MKLSAEEHRAIEREGQRVDPATRIRDDARRLPAALDEIVLLQMQLYVANVFLEGFAELLDEKVERLAFVEDLLAAVLRERA